MKHIFETPSAFVVALLVALAPLFPGCATQTETSPSVSPQGAVIKSETPILPVPAQSDLRTPVIFAGSRGIAMSVKPQDLDGMAGVELWYTTDQGNNWLNHGFIEGRPEALKFAAPADGKYGFLKVFVDKAGHRSVEPRFGILPEQYIVVDTTPPVVEIISPNGNEVYRAGATTVVKWVAEDVNLTPSPVTIEISSDGGKTWLSLAKQEANDGLYYMDIPALSSREYKIRVTAGDAAGNIASDESDLPFTIDGLPPVAQITGPVMSDSSKAEIRYAANDIGGAGLASLKLYTTRNDGATWEYYGEDTDLESPFPVTLLDGAYGLKLVAADKMGNMTDVPSPGTSPQTTIHVDATKPEIVLMSFNDGGTYASGHPYQILWGARDNVAMPTHGIMLEYSHDNGLSFAQIGANLENNGVFAWTTPDVGGKQCRIRVTAWDMMKNKTEVVSQAFSVDAAVPEAVAVGPKTAASNNVSVEYALRGTGISPLARVTLWATADDGKTWMRVADDADLKSPMTFAKSDGRYGLYVTCATVLGMQSGKRQKEPEAGTPPQVEVNIDATAPTLALTDFSGFHRGGERIELLWECREANPDEKGMSILYSDNGGASWTEVAGGLDPRLGKHAWELPRTSSRASLFRFTAIDSLGNKTVRDLSKVFVVDSDRPSTRILKRPDRTRFRRMTLLYEATDATSGVREVTAYGINRDGKRGVERLASVERATGELTIDFPEDGLWDLAVIAADAAGNAERDSVTERDSLFSVVVDTLPPQVEVKKHVTADNRTVWVDKDGGISWSSVDSRSPADRVAVHVEYSSDAGKTWFLLADKQKNADTLDVSKILAEGKGCRFRIAAVDEAGNQGVVETADMGMEIFPRNLLALASSLKEAVVGSGENEFSWRSKRTAKEAWLEQRKDDESEWKRIATLESASLKAKVPGAPGTWHYRVSAVDQYGRIDYSDPVSVKVVLPAAPVLVLSADGIEKGEIAVGAKVSMTVEVSGGTVGEVWIERRDREAWERTQNIKGKSVEIDVGREAGRYSLRAAGKDTFGREIVSNVIDLSVVVPSLPVVSLTRGDPGKDVVVGSAIAMMCSVSGEKTVALWLEFLRGERWEKVKDVGVGAFTVDAGQTPGGLTMRVAAKDRYERISTSESVTVEVIPPPLPVIAIGIPRNAVIVAGGSIAVEIDGFEQLKQCVLHLRKGDEAWVSLGPVTARKSDLALPGEPGEYCLRAGGVDRYDREVVSSEAVIVVRTEEEIKSTLTLMNFRGGEIVWGGNSKIIFIKTEGHATLDRVAVEISDQSGVDGTWRIVPRETLTEVKHGFHWKIPVLTGRNYRLRITWKGEKGSTLTDASPEDFAIDSTPPSALATGPAVAETMPVEIDCAITESIARVADVALYYTQDDGMTWLSGNITPAGKPSFFAPVAEGKYGITLVARNTLNKSAGAPRRGDRPQLTIEYRSKVALPSLTVKMLPLKGEAVSTVDAGLLRGGSTLLIEWNCSRDDPRATASLSLYAGERLVEEIAAGLPASGSYAWKTRKEDLRDCSIVVTVQADGRAATDRISSFRIDNSPPKVRSGFDPFE